MRRASSAPGRAIYARLDLSTLDYTHCYIIMFSLILGHMPGSPSGQAGEADRRPEEEGPEQCMAKQMCCRVVKSQT